MSATVHIDTGGLTAFAVRLRELVASFPSEERLFLRAAAEAVALDAKRRSSGSITTSPTVRVIEVPPVGERQAIAVGAGFSGTGNKGKLPLLLEGGNGANKFSSWNHPVFGNQDVIVSQKAKPYLKPALDAEEEAIETIASEAIQLQLDFELEGRFP